MPHEIIVLFQPGVLCKLPKFSYRNLLNVLQSWIRVPRSAPNDPRGSKRINMGIWGRETFVPGDHSIATVSQGWMNNSRKGMSTDKKDKGKRSLSLTSYWMENQKRHGKRWCVIITDQLYYKNKVPYLQRVWENRKFSANLCTTSQQKSRACCMQLT